MFSQLLEKLTRRARNKHSAGHSALAVLHSLHNAGRLAALRTIRALGSVHHFFTICCLCNLGHSCLLTKILLQATGLDETITWNSGVASKAGNLYSPQSILHE